MYIQCYKYMYVSTYPHPPIRKNSHLILSLLALTPNTSIITSSKLSKADQIRVENTPPRKKVKQK